MKTVAIVRRITFIGAMLIGLLTVSQAQPIQVSNSFKPKKNSLIGDTAHLTYTVVQSPEADVFFPFYEDYLKAPIEVFETQPCDSNKLNDRVLVSQRIAIMALDSGQHHIPAMPFVLKETGDTVWSDSLIFEVFLVDSVDTTKAIKPIKPILDAPWTFAEFWQEYSTYVWLGLLAVLVIAAVLLYFFVFRRKDQADSPIVRKAKKPAHITALERLDRLRREKAWQHNSTLKQYHTEVSETLRQYIEERFNLPALELTTDETLQVCRYSGVIKTVELEHLQQVLTLADYVKFAKIKPYPNENELSLENAFKFVETTKQEADTEATPQNNKTDSNITPQTESL